MIHQNVKADHVYRLSGVLWPLRVTRITGDDSIHPMLRRVEWRRVSWCRDTNRWVRILGGRDSGVRRLDTFAKAATVCGVWPNRLTGPYR